MSDTRDLWDELHTHVLAAVDLHCPELPPAQRKHIWTAPSKYADATTNAPMVIAAHTRRPVREVAERFASLLLSLLGPYG